MLLFQPDGLRVIKVMGIFPRAGGDSSSEAKLSLFSLQCSSSNRDAPRLLSSLSTSHLAPGFSVYPFYSSGPGGFTKVPCKCLAYDLHGTS